MSEELGPYNISEKYGYQWIAPERTGSRKVAEVLSYFGFTNKGRNIHLGNNHVYTHQVIFDDSVKNYKLICNARNPYAKTLSIFRNLYKTEYRNAGKKEFKRYLLNDLKNGQTLWMVQRPILDRTPDFIIRLEYMFEDLKKIPFVLEKFSEEQLKSITSHPKPLMEFEEFYDQEMKDIVYHYTSHLFKMWGYEK